MTTIGAFSRSSGTSATANQRGAPLSTVPPMYCTTCRTRTHMTEDCRIQQRIDATLANKTKQREERAKVLKERSELAQYREKEREAARAQRDKERERERERRRSPSRRRDRSRSRERTRDRSRERGTKRSRSRSRDRDRHAKTPSSTTAATSSSTAKVSSTAKAAPAAAPVASSSASAPAVIPTAASASASSDAAPTPRDKIRIPVVAFSQHIPAPERRPFPKGGQYGRQVIPIGAVHPTVVVSSFASTEERKTDLRARFDHILRDCLSRSSNNYTPANPLDKCYQQRSAVEHLMNGYAGITSEAAANEWHDMADGWMLRTMALVFAVCSGTDSIDEMFHQTLTASVQASRIVQPQPNEALEHYWGRVYQTAGNSLGFRML